MTPRFNTLLAELPASEYEKLAPHMELVSLVKGETIFKMRDIPTHVYYPVGAIVSMMIDMADDFILVMIFSICKYKKAVSNFETAFV